MAVAVIAYMGFSTFSTFIMPLVVAVVLGMIFEPVASFLGRAMPRQLASILVLVGIGVLSVVAVAVVIFGVIDQGPEIVAQTQAAIDQGRDWLASQGMTVDLMDDVQQQLQLFVDEVRRVCSAMCPVPSPASAASSWGRSSRSSSSTSCWPSGPGWRNGWPRTWASGGPWQGIVTDATRSFRDYSTC